METTCPAMSELLSLTMTMQGEAGDIWQSSNTTSNSVRPDLGQTSLFRLDGQVILPPLMTSAKKREAQLARQRAKQLEEQRSRSSQGSRSSRTSQGSHSMASPRSGLSQTQTYIYDSTRQGQQQQQQHRGRPQTLGFDVPTIQVNPPTPLMQTQTPTLPLSPERRLQPNKITERIQQFEQSGIGGHIGQILRSSTSPALAEPHLSPQGKPVAKNTVKLPPPVQEPVALQRSRSFTLEQPSPALVENMRRQGYSPNFQRETIESQAKRVVRQPSPPNPNTSTSLSSRKDQEREREIERMIELVMNKYGLVEARRRGWVRQYLRGHREPMDRLMEYQEGERRRMQAAFEEQQRQLIEQLCAQLENPDRSNSRLSDSSSNSNSSTNSSATTCSTSRTITLSITSPRNCPELDGFLAADIAPPTSAARKCLFSPHPTPSLGYESEPQLLGDSSTASSTPRLLPLRNSSLTNSRRQATGAAGAGGVTKKTAPGRRIQPKVSSPTKSLPTSRPGTGASNASAAGAGSGRRKNVTAVVSPKKNLQGESSLRLPKASSHKNVSLCIIKTQPGCTNKTFRINFHIHSKFFVQKPEIPQEHVQNLELDLDQEEREWAATRINAAVRGFLLRRLFKTEQVQRIVQTIRDTLIFVLNLHLETRGKDVEAEEPGNLRLKARLLQQLYSASRTLHLIFFQTSTKERMEIISRDRKRKKLLALSPKRR
ncbi:uncharacterized protein LOC110180352 [Drosophila serrata]|uniref:uncharacterized protein LOC110180352 n=1 Tax=Drosophila serrata TaxID=7274 RepID=UPI000A1CF948|nr:uncharacterized protein LOC110180352 [Drosophila serrata]